MNNMLTRGILRLSKRRKSGSGSADSDSTRSITSETPEKDGMPGKATKDEWTKYDERLIDCINRSDIVKLKETLKKKGVSPVKVSRVGKTAIHIAVKKRCMEGVDLMLQEHPDLSCIDMQGRTVYHVASLNGDTIMLKKMLDYSRWNLDIKDVKGMTALHYAVQSGETACVKLLLDNDSPVDIKDGENRTPLLMAVGENKDKIATMLIEHGVDFNAENKQGRTAIVIACSLGMTQIVSLLLAKGADRSVMNRKSINLDKIASDAGHTDIVEILANGVNIPIDVNGESDSHDGTGDANKDHTSGSNGNVAEGTPVNGHNGNIIEICIDDKHVMDNGTEDEVKRRSNTVDVIENLHRNTNGNHTPRMSFTHPSINPNRRSMNKSSEDQSLTSAIIESLMGFDSNTENLSESSVTDEQLQMYEKAEQERKELKNMVTQKELFILELQAEIESLKNKVSLEIGLRFYAEKEVHQLKYDIESLSKRSNIKSDQTSLPNGYSEKTNEHQDGEESGIEEGLPMQEEKELTNVEGLEKGENLAKEDLTKEDLAKEDLGKENLAQEEDIVNEEENSCNTQNNKINDEKDKIDNENDSSANELSENTIQIENDIGDIDSTSENISSHGNVDTDAYSSRDYLPDSDTDESIMNLGYRKKSLGTAKQHINMLEERILCLEDELSDKADNISELEIECKNAKELVDRSNTTTIALETHNELKSEHKKERNDFKEQISSLQEKVENLEETVEEARREKAETQAKLDCCADLQTQLESEIENNRNFQKQVEELRNEINTLRGQLLEEESKSLSDGDESVKSDVSESKSRSDNDETIPQHEYVHEKSPSDGDELAKSDVSESKSQSDDDDSILQHEDVQNEVSPLEQADKLQEQLSVEEAESNVSESESQSDDDESIHQFEDLQNQVVFLQEQADRLQEKLSEYDQTFEETLLCYRNNLIALHQNNLDSRLEEVLARIVKLRSS